MPRMAINCAAVEHVDHSARCAATLNPTTIPPMLMVATAIEIITSANVKANTLLRATGLIVLRVFILAGLQGVIAAAIEPERAKSLPWLRQFPSPLYRVAFGLMGQKRPPRQTRNQDPFGNHRKARPATLKGPL